MIDDISETAPEIGRPKKRISFTVAGGLAIFSLVVFVIYAAYTNSDWKSQATKDLVLFVASWFLSYRFARITFLAESKREVKLLATQAIGRIRDLYRNIRGLKDNISQYACEDQVIAEQLKNIGRTLEMFEGAVKISFDEIKHAADLPMSQQYLFDIEQPATRQSVEFVTNPIVVVSQRAARATTLHFQKTILCPNCRTENTPDIAEHAGATAVVICANCSGRFMVHRRSDGELFIGGDGIKRLLPFDFECVNQQCGSRVKVYYDEKAVEVVRACTECYQSYRIRPQEMHVEKNDLGPTVLTENSIVNSGGIVGSYCSNIACGTFLRYDVRKAIPNRKGDRVIQCFSCGQIGVLRPDNETFVTQR